MRKGKFLALGLAIAMGMSIGSTAMAADATKGAKVFKKRCKACHTVKKGKHKVGPSLVGIVGRKAGTADGFKKYKGLKGSDIVWDDAKMDGWLKNPKKFLGKRTTMTFKLKKAGERADVIAYLKTLK